MGTPGVAYTQDGAYYNSQGRLVPGLPARLSEDVQPAGAVVVHPAQQSASAPVRATRCSPAAERMRRSRKRRRDSLRCINFDVRDKEIEGLVTSGLLDPVARNDRVAISKALGKLLDRIPPERWPLGRR